MPDPASMTNLLTEKWIRGLTFRAFLDFSKKNVEAMRRNYDAVEIGPPLAAEIKAFGKEARLLVIGADWCGDHVANVPPIARLVDLNPKLQLRIVDRDRNDDLMQHFLTNGGKAIPIVIVGPASLATHAVWGPRPAACQAIMNEHKGKKPKEEIYPLIREWYAKDKNQTVLAEIWKLVQSQAQAG